MLAKQVQGQCADGSVPPAPENNASSGIEKVGQALVDSRLPYVDSADLPIVVYVIQVVAPTMQNPCRVFQVHTLDILRAVHILSCVGQGC